tara:strand:- start:259 stop:504 length:246 start_codon:yes stop_codon:yes gene_type:complete
LRGWYGISREYLDTGQINCISSILERCHMIELDLNNNDAEALLRHAEEYVPNTSDARENARLTDALADLAEAIRRSFNSVE